MAKDGSRPSRTRGRSTSRPAIEPLEGRRLLSSTPITVQTVSSGHATYRISISGPGSVSVRGAGKGEYAINLTGSTGGTAVTIGQVAVSSKYAGSLLPVAKITASSGSLGQINGLGSVDLLGTINSLTPLGSIQLGAVGPAARIGAAGGLGSLTVGGAIDLGPKGSIVVAGDLHSLQAGSIDLAGGKIVVGQDLGGISTPSLVIGPGGQVAVGHDAGQIAVGQDATLSGGAINVAGDAAGLNVGGHLNLSAGGRLAVVGDLTGSIAVAANLAIDGGQVDVGRDLAGSVTVGGNVSATNGGNLTVGRDLTGSLSVGGNLALAGGGAVVVGRTIGAGGGSSSGLTIGGNLTTGPGSYIQAGGNLEGLLVGGTITGQGTASVDLSVGLDLNNLTVDGGAANSGGVANFNLDVGKNIVGLNVLHGLFNDFITAGVLITNATVGADGPVAVFDTEIRAGVEISNMTLNGDVKSDRPVNPSGRRTRIIAGEDRAGDFELGGNIVNFQITGSLIDAAVVASVQPYGGNGSEQITPAPAPAPGAPDYYDAPGGGYPVADLGLPYAAPPFDATVDPTIHDTVLPGEINHPFAPTSAKMPYPSQSTVLGGVITTAHANNSDYAGFFAADTSGVFVGTIPPTSS